MGHQILCIGQSDSCAGTGIQADIKTSQAFDVYASTIITAVSVQNTTGIFDLHVIPPKLVRAQITRVMEDLNPNVFKMGMLANADIINMLGDMLDERASQNGMKVVIDPVMTNRTGFSLLDKDARDALKRRLLIHADLITPNIKEAEELTGIKISDVDDMCHAAETLMTLGAKAVIIKGGALNSDSVYDVLSDENGTEINNNPRVVTKSTHGAGTTLSTAIACSLSKGLCVRDSYAHARNYVDRAIDEAESIGAGYGPLNHLAKPAA